MKRLARFRGRRAAFGANCAVRAGDTVRRIVQPVRLAAAPEQP